jgi:two-component system NarL family sensor kinase
MVSAYSRHTFSFLFRLLVVLPFSSLQAQEKRMDSLNQVVRTSNQDTSIAAAYVALTEIYCVSKPDTVETLGKKALQLIDKGLPSAGKKARRTFLQSKADALNNIGYIAQIHGKLNDALDYFTQGLKINEDLGIQKSLANSLNNIGVVYVNLGQNLKGLDYFHRGLKIQEALGDKQSMATTLGNIGAIHGNLGETEKAVTFCMESLKLREEVGDQFGIAYSLNNIAVFYYTLGKAQEALNYNLRSLAIREKIGDKQGAGNSLNNIGAIYTHLGDETKALEFLYRSLRIRQALNAKQGTATSMNNIAQAYLHLLTHEQIGKKALTDSVFQYANKALHIASASGYVEVLRNANLTLSQADSLVKNPSDALVHYKSYIFYRDSMVNESARKTSIRKQMLYEFDQKELREKAEAEKLATLHEEELKRQKLINWSASGSLGLLLLSVTLLFNRSRLKQKQRYQEQLNRQQKEQAIAVMETQEQERKRIAEDLHDSLGHLLSAAKLNLQTIPGEPDKLVKQSLNLMNDAAVEIRNITFNLMPRTLEEEGLLPCLQELAQKVNVTGILRLNLYVHGMEGFNLEKQIQFNIYRIIQEAVNNVIKYAQAQEINIQLIKDVQELTVMIEDDGQGFDQDLVKKNGRGLKNMQTRTAWLNGTTSIDTAPGRGTTITLLIPV